MRKKVYLWRATTRTQPRNLSPDWSAVGRREKGSTFTVLPGRYRLHIAYLEKADESNLRTRCECRSEPFEVLEPTTYMRIVEENVP